MKAAVALLQPDLLLLTALLTTAMPNQQKTTQASTGAGLREGVKVMDRRCPHDARLGRRGRRRRLRRGRHRGRGQQVGRSRLIRRL